MQVDEVVESICKIDVETLCMIDCILSYIATGSIFMPCPKVLQPGMTSILIPT